MKTSLSGDQIPDDEAASCYQQDNNSLENGSDIHNHLLSSFRSSIEINNQGTKQSNEPTNNQKEVSGNNPVLLSNSHLTSSNKNNAILTHQAAKSVDSTTANSLVSKGTVVANPNPPNINPLAKSKKKLANPFACSRFKDNSINQTLTKNKNSVKNAVWTKVIYLKVGQEIATLGEAAKETPPRWLKDRDRGHTSPTGTYQP
ncbi:hypothetical protein HZB97_02780 [Candidatus Gottesmanbacteria bacterium]|nr:hypothetical protein [Candidatus Gottesmanbacteria bacterium]